MSSLSVTEAARIAAYVANIRKCTVGELKNRGGTLGCEGLFMASDDSRISAKSGGNVIRQLSGFGYIAAGEGVRQGEILVVTRGTKSVCDIISDLHVGMRRGPNGLPVHLGFQRVWESYAEEMKSFLQGKNPSHIHCVGHSLGGALATLNADYFAAFELPVSLYTFGSPRVGQMAFCQALTQQAGETNIYRVSHNTDPVTMVPAFPFTHVPFRGKHYAITRSGSIRFGEHFMDSYVGSVAGKSWSSLANAQLALDWTDEIARVWLDAVKAGGGSIVMYAAASLDMIAQALRWLFRRVAVLGLGGFAYGVTFGSAATAVDILGSMLNRCAELSKEIADDVKTIMSAILKFLGRSAVTAAEMTQQFIRWVFDLLYSTISSMANRAMMGDEKSE